MKTKLWFPALLVFMLVISACGPVKSASLPLATVAPVIPKPAPATAASMPPAVAAPASPAMVDVGQNATLGSFLVDANNKTLYVFANDTANTSNCSGTCATTWPPLLTNGAPVAGMGVTASMLGTITRSDGSTQVTYNSWPLYYFAGDKAAGDINGEGVKNIWFVISPAGASVTPVPASPTPAASVSGYTVNVSQNQALGSFLVDSANMTLYMFTKDTPGVSNCTGNCAAIWPPLLVTSSPMAGAGVDASLLGTITRSDGSMQVTYNGMPLYYYSKDMAAGDTNGQGINSVWYVVSPSVQQPAATQSSNGSSY
jgi:predicted lipoprotein with Yx(FWY)xxD motif